MERKDLIDHILKMSNELSKEELELIYCLVQKMWLKKKSD